MRKETELIVETELESKALDLTFVIWRKLGLECEPMQELFLDVAIMIYDQMVGIRQKAVTEPPSEN